MKNVLVTGASGYLGSKISIGLNKAGYKVYALCRSLPNDLSGVFNDIEIIKGDVTHPETLQHLLSLPIDIVVHTVSLDHNSSESLPVDDVNKINVLSTWQLLNAFLSKKIEKFVYLSTIQVIGKLPNEVIFEGKDRSPENLYGLTHSFGEDLVNYYNKKSETSCLSLRLSNGYGAPVFTENNCWSLLINDLCRSAFYDKKIVLNSDGTPQRDFIHINDIAASVCHVLNQATKINTVYHVSSGQTYSLLEIAHKIKDIYKLKYKTEITVYHSRSIPSNTPTITLTNYKISNKRLLDTGFFPAIDLHTGILELFDYFENINVAQSGN